VKADDLSKLNAAFFTTNAFVSVILFVTFAGGSPKDSFMNFSTIAYWLR